MSPEESVSSVSTTPTLPVVETIVESAQASQESWMLGINDPALGYVPEQDGAPAYYYDKPAMKPKGKPHESKPPVL